MLDNLLYELDDYSYIKIFDDNDLIYSGYVINYRSSTLYRICGVSTDLVYNTIRIHVKKWELIWWNESDILTAIRIRE